MQMISQKGRSSGSGGRLQQSGLPQQRTCQAALGRKGRAGSCRALAPWGPARHMNWSPSRPARAVLRKHSCSGRIMYAPFRTSVSHRSGM